MSQTDIYGLGYADILATLGGADLSMDQRRFQAIENQLLHLYSTFGNGIIDDNPLSPSWRIQTVPGDSTGTSVQITPGHGHVAWKYAETLTATVVKLPLPPGGSYPATFYLYATPNATTPDQKSVTFFPSTVEINDPDHYIGLGTVDAVNPQGKVVLTPNNDAAHGRVNISLFATLAAIVNRHKHIGGANNPTPIDLGTNVQGKLSGNNIQDLDASAVTTGTLSADRLPLIDHSTLQRIGTLTHDQIDSLLASILSPQGYRLSDLEHVNLMQLVLALKRKGYAASDESLVHIDQNLINALFYVPSNESQPLEATVPNTVTVPLATIDRTNHKIVGGTPTSVNTDQIVYTTDSDFSLAVTQAATRDAANPTDPYLSHDIEVTGSGVGAGFTIARPVNYRGLAGIDLTPWSSGYVFFDRATKQAIAPPASPPLNHFIDDYGVRRYLYLNFASAQDWSACQNLGLGFEVGAASRPGDLQVFLIAADGTQTATLVPTTGGASQTLKVTNSAVFWDRTRGTGSNLYTTVGLDSMAASSARTQIIGVGFFWDTATAWDGKDVDFGLVVPTDSQIADTRVIAARDTPPSPAVPDTSTALFIWNSTYHAPSARLVFRFDSNFGNGLTTYTALTTDSDTPARVRVQTRASDSAAALPTTVPWPVTGNAINANSGKGRYIDLIVELTASLDLTTAPTVADLGLVFMGPGANTSKTWNQADAPDATGRYGGWDTGRRFDNIAVGGSFSDAQGGTLNYLSLSDTSKVGRFQFLRGNDCPSAFSLSDADDAPLAFGAPLYLSPWQVFHGGASHGFTAPRDFTALPSGHLVVADTGNDRVLELDASGVLVRAIQGNIRLRQMSRDFAAMQAVYNPRLATMWIAFSQNVSAWDATKMTLVSGQVSVSLGTQGISVVLDKPTASDSKSATLRVTFPTAIAQQIAAWTSPVTVLIASGSVTSGGSSTGGNGGGSISPATTGSGGGTSTATAACDGTGLPAYVTGLYNALGSGALAGGFHCYPGLTTLAPITTNEGDFDGDGQVLQTPILGPGGQSGNVSLTVTSGEIVFDNLFSPVSIQVDALGNWIVGAAGASTVTCYDGTSTTLWSIDPSVISLQDGLGGSAYQMTNGNVLIAAPAASGSAQGQVLVVNRASGAPVPVARIPVDGDAVRALPRADNLQFWVAVDDRAGAKSHVLRIDSGGKVLWAWGDGVVTHPTGLRLLPNGDLLVSE